MGLPFAFSFFSYVNKQLILTRFDLTLCHNACKSANKSIWGPFFFINVILKKKKKIIFVKLLFEKICKYQIANFVNIPRSKRRRHHFWLPCLATIPSVSLSFGNLVECQWSPTSAKYKKNKLRNNIPNSKIQGVRIIWMKCKVQVQNYFKREKIEVTATGP